MKNLNYSFLFITLFLLISVLNADIKLPSIISNNMVIQQNTELQIWGWADPGEKIKIKGSWQKFGTSTIADENGNWIVKLKSPEPGGPHKITINGNNEIVLTDVLVGEVWFASGQSNMAMSLKNCVNAEAEIAAANYPDIRFFRIERTYADEPQSDCKGLWKYCNPETVKEFSAAAYFLGREIHKKLNVPVGLISASKGGSPAEAWIRKDVLESDSVLSAVFDMWKKWETEYSEAEKTYNINYETWVKNKELAETYEKPIPEKPAMPTAVDMVTKPHRRPGALYNAMVAPIIHYTIKGVVWYQGSNNMDRPVQYRKLFPALIDSWRKDWGQGDFPFYYVQNAPYRFKKNQSKASLLREAQAMAMSLPNTGMVVTTDIGDLNSNHPKNKQDVGKRLALWALAKTYGHDNIVYSGPMYKSMKIVENKIQLYFDHIGSGLMAKGENLIHFEIAGQDKKYINATAIIHDSTVVVYSENVLNPVAVRYGWSITSLPNLFNKEGLPAAPFRTDNW